MTRYALALVSNFGLLHFIEGKRGNQAVDEAVEEVEVGEVSGSLLRF